MKILVKHSFSNWLFALDIMTALILLGLFFAEVSNYNGIYKICKDQQTIISQYEKLLPKIPGKSVTW